MLISMNVTMAPTNAVLTVHVPILMAATLAPVTMVSMVMVSTAQILTSVTTIHVDSTLFASTPTEHLNTNVPSATKVMQ